MKVLNDKQKNEVIEMGFEQLFNLGINKVHTRMAFWVLDNFDDQRSEINIEDGRRVHIEAADVHRVFGLPTGGIPIVKKKKFQKCKLLEEWTKIFSKEKRMIVVKDVATKMILHKEGGEMFRRHFVVLLTVCLIETTSNWYITPQILSCLGDLSRVEEFDWCEFVIRALVEHKLMWEKNKKKHFSGPILFLTSFYVDRVVLYNRSPTREFPTMKNWSHLLMKRRENAEIKSGGFGGDIHPAFVAPNNPSQPKTPINDANDKDGYIDVYTEQFIWKAKLIAITMVEIIAMVEGAPHHLLGTSQFKKFVDASCQLLGQRNDGASSSFKTQAQTQFIDTQSEDDFWGNPEMLAMIEEIETAMAKMNDFIKKLDDGPSFSLGVTQDGGCGLDNVLGDSNFSLRDDDEEDVSFVRSNRRTRGMEINENKHIGEPQQEKQILKTNQKEVLYSDCLQVETKQEKQESFIAKGKGKEHVLIFESWWCFVDVNSSICLVIETDEEKHARDLSKGKRKDQLLIDAENNEEIIREQTTVKSRLKLKHKQKIADPETHQMERRNRTSMKKTEKFMSPFVKRVVDISSKFSNVEKQLWIWIFYNKAANHEELVFASDDIEMKRGDMMTMRGNVEIRSNILDAWNAIMNRKELSRASDSPCRFFASTKPSKFCRDVLDNKLPHEGVNMNPGVSVPFLLSDFFYEYLLGKGMRAKAVGIAKAEMNRLDVPWRGKHNNFDCWIYVMRHMETYMGDGLKNWKCGLRNNCDVLLKKMRVKYCAEILSADINIYKDRNTEATSLHYRVSSEDGPINFDKLLKNKMEVVSFNLM